MNLSKIITFKLFYNYIPRHYNKIVLQQHRNTVGNHLFSVLESLYAARVKKK